LIDTVPDILARIVARKREEVVRVTAALGGLERAAEEKTAGRRDFHAALAAAGTAVIAEIKKASPSRGLLCADFDPVRIARQYHAGGAAALSVLTDRIFFGGSVDDLQRARAVVEIPVLRKDFTIDETQVYETRVIGADAVLLVVAALGDDGLLASLRARADELGLASLFEVHDGAELDRALAAGATLVGVNARDLGTFDEDLGVSERLAARIPSAVTAVAESAIRTPDDAGRMADAGYDAVLVGEALARSDDPVALVQAMTEHQVRRRG